MGGLRCLCCFEVEAICGTAHYSVAHFWLNDFFQFFNVCFHNWGSVSRYDFARMRLLYRTDRSSKGHKALRKINLRIWIQFNELKTLHHVSFFYGNHSTIHNKNFFFDDFLRLQIFTALHKLLWYFIFLSFQLSRPKKRKLPVWPKMCLSHEDEENDDTKRMAHD